MSNQNGKRPAGYIVESNGRSWGVGPSRRQALQNARKWSKHREYRNVRVLPATYRLIYTHKHDLGAGWRLHGGVADLTRTGESVYRQLRSDVARRAWRKR